MLFKDLFTELKLFLSLIEKKKKITLALKVSVIKPRFFIVLIDNYIIVAYKMTLLLLITFLWFHVHVKNIDTQEEVKSKLLYNIFKCQSSDFS